MAVLVIPIMILNFFSGIVGGIWLGVLGEWGVVGMGLGIAIGGTLFASILMLPGMALAFPAVAATERGNTAIAAFFGSLSLLYTYFLMGTWAIFIYLLFIGKSREIIPILLWSYSTSTVTWSYLAQKEAHTNEYSGISSMFHQFGCIALMIYAYGNYRHPDWYQMSIWYGVPMALGAAFSIFMVFANSRQAYR